MTILNTFRNTKLTFGGWIMAAWLAIYLFFCIVAVLYTYWVIRDKQLKEEYKNIISLWVYLAVLLLIAVLTFDSGTLLKTTTRHECTINDKTSIEDVFDKYDVIEHRGEIWVLEEKEIEVLEDE